MKPKTLIPPKIPPRKSPFPCNLSYRHTHPISPISATTATYEQTGPKQSRGNKAGFSDGVEVYEVKKKVPNPNPQKAGPG
jgi:hypothetical protein